MYDVNILFSNIETINTTKLLLTNTSTGDSYSTLAIIKNENGVIKYSFGSSANPTFTELPLDTEYLETPVSISTFGIALKINICYDASGVLIHTEVTSLHKGDFIHTLRDKRCFGC